MRRRSVGFLEQDGATWSCYLVTFRDREMRWHGYFSFRPRGADADAGEVRTADIFLEASEEEIARRARSLGRPLLGGLLASARHARERDSRDPGRLRGWFRELLWENAREIADGWSGENGDARRSGARAASEGPAPDEARIRSLYESYRLDQVAHFICLVEPDEFRRAVDRILDGRSFDFGARDRLQFAMMVVDYIEERLPLPPFEVWAKDYLAHPERYHRYAHALHREGRLP